MPLLVFVLLGVVVGVIAQLIVDRLRHKRPNAMRLAAAGIVGGLITVTWIAGASTFAIEGGVSAEAASTEAIAAANTIGAPSGIGASAVTNALLEQSDTFDPVPEGPPPPTPTGSSLASPPETRGLARRSGSCVSVTHSPPR